MLQKTINLEEYRSGAGRVYSGREYGQQLRRKLALDEADGRGDLEVIVEIPEDTLSLNSSFFLGVFGPSVRALGKERFFNRYHFVCNDRVRTNIETGVRRALLSTNAIEKFAE